LSKSGQELKKLLCRAAGENESDVDDKSTDVMITILLRTHIFFHRRLDALANLILWNRIHLCICFVQQEDDLPSPELAPKQLVPKSEPVDSNPDKPTPSAHAQSTTSSSKSTQKRKSGGGDANTSNGATSKKIKIEPVCSFFILHTTHVKFELQSYNHKLHQVLCFKVALFLGI